MTNFHLPKVLEITFVKCQLKQGTGLKYPHLYQKKASF